MGSRRKDFRRLKVWWSGGIRDTRRRLRVRRRELMIPGLIRLGMKKKTINRIIVTIFSIFSAGKVEKYEPFSHNR